MPSTAYQPETSVEKNPGTSPSRRATSHDTSNYPCFLVMPSVATYGDGVAPASANYGDSNTEEGGIEQIDITPIHPQSNTAYDKTTAFAAGDELTVITHIQGKVYWLKASSLTATIHKTKLVCAGSGIVKAALAHTGTPLPVHMWLCKKTVSSATYTLGRYMGIVNYNTA